MRPQCKRMYSALPSQCDRICKGRCEAPCVSDASTESRVQRPERTAGEGVSTTFGASFRTTPTFEVSQSCACARDCDCLTRQPPPYSRRPDWTAARHVWHHLTASLAMLSLNDFGRPWPNPRRDVIAQLLDQFGADICIEAAEETRRIIQADDWAPNITNLFGKKCVDIARQRQAVRAEIREALGR